MKKFMFSAIAMIAFVGSSMANTNSTVEENKAVEIDCVSVAMAATDAADPNGTMTIMQYNAFYQGQYNACIKSKNELTKCP